MPKGIYKHKPMSEENKRRLSIIFSGDRNPSKRLEVKRIIGEKKRLEWQNPNSLMRTKVEKLLRDRAINNPPMLGRKRPKHSIRMKGSNNPAWQGGTETYYRHIGRRLLKNLGFNINGKIVHHIDKNIKNNLVDNLKIFNTLAEHTKLHWKQGDIRKLKNG